MKVFKFGGASVKNAAGIRNVGKIVSSFQKPLLVVVSAMGKTTDQLEKVVAAAFKKQDYTPFLDESRKYHSVIINDVFDDASIVTEAVLMHYRAIEKAAGTVMAFDRLYDQIVSAGELISTTIVHHYLQSIGLPSRWLDARTCISTDSTFREGKVNWDKTQRSIEHLGPELRNKIILTQGFIGADAQGYTTTLGREGSDFSAAIFASCLGAESVTIWKDVPGVMNADPKRLKAAMVFDELPFKEAAEMTYYGASVIHPKTIKPLANRGIPLLVKNFDDPSLPGTRIHECKIGHLPPLIVFKDNQCLVSCKVTDYTFVNEQHLVTIFHVLNELDIRINVMQNSAISFSFCIDFRESRIPALISKLSESFEVYYNSGLTLVTVKNYDEASFETWRKKPGVLLEQSSRSTLQVLLKTESINA